MSIVSELFACDHFFTPHCVDAIFPVFRIAVAVDGKSCTGQNHFPFQSIRRNFTVITPKKRKFPHLFHRRAAAKGGEGTCHARIRETPFSICVKVWRHKRTCSEKSDIQIAVRGQLRNEIMHVHLPRALCTHRSCLGGVKSQLATLTATIFRPLGPRAFILRSTQCAPFKSIQSSSRLADAESASRGYHFLMCLHSLREVFKSDSARI